MTESQQQTWTLWDRGIVVQAGTLIEYQDVGQVRVARVERVRIVSVPPYADHQVIDAQVYGPLNTRREGPRARTVQPERVLRVLDAPPPPPVKALTSLWSPRDSKNPFLVESLLTHEDWREIARWYPFSVRALLSQEREVRWQEQARTRSWEQAKEAMTTLAHIHREHFHCWVVMKCELRGKEGREKPVLWYPSQSSVAWTLHEVGLLKTV